MKRKMKKLSLNRETLGSLEESSMRQAVGGNTYVDSICQPCTTNTKCSDCCTLTQSRNNC